MASFDNQTGDICILRSATHQPPVNGFYICIAGVRKFLWQFPNGQYAVDGGDGISDEATFVPSDAKSIDLANISTAFIWRFDTSDDDIFGAEIFNLALSFLADPFTDGQQPNDACHANEDAEHCQ